MKKQTCVKPKGVSGPMHMCCNICLHILCAGTHDAIAPVKLPAGTDSPSLCNPNKLTSVRGKYQHFSVSRAETKAFLRADGL